MIRLNDLSISQGGVDLIVGATTLIAPGDRLALIGPNGSGKTTLLQVLAGELAPERGEIERPTLRLSVLEQMSPKSDAQAWQYVLESDDVLLSAQRELARANDSGDGMAIAHALDAWQMAGGHDSQARACALLHGLGFDAAMTERSVRELSGGWRMRLNLARALFRPADLILLDEPTNHLDLDAILWLEQRLRRVESTLIIVSHDRQFLDAVVNGTLSIENKTLHRYRGGYSACETQRAERLASQQRQGAVIEREKQRLQAFVDRFRAQATKAKQVQSRLKAMQRLPQLAALSSSRHLNLRFAPVGDMPNPVIRTEELSAGYGDTVVLSDVTLTISRAARVGLLGRNGHGKTTLVRTLIGELPALGGSFTRSSQLRVGYFAQDAVDQLAPGESPLSLMRALSLKLDGQASPDGQLRSWLGRFGFSNDDALRPCGPMSGGEKSRLVLAQTLWPAPELLILDEPTNHLDGDTRDALTEALISFEGVLILVSHDRHLLSACVDTFFLVANGRATLFDGDLDDYAQWLTQRDSATDNPAPAAVIEKDGSRRDQRRDLAAKRALRANELKPLKSEMARLDKEMAALQSHLAEIDGKLADPEFYASGDVANDALSERALLAGKLERLEARWLRNAEKQESITASLQS